MAWLAHRGSYAGSFGAVGEAPTLHASSGGFEEEVLHDIVETIPYGEATKDEADESPTTARA